MQYPKQLMSITELVAMGYSRWDLRCYANAKGAPVIRTIGKGKTLYLTEKLDDFIIKMQKIN